MTTSTGRFKIPSWTLETSLTFYAIVKNKKMDYMTSRREII